MVIITSIFQAMFGWRKSCEELIKRMDPDLPYYYHTSTHNRFYEGELPKFDEPTHRTKKNSDLLEENFLVVVWEAELHWHHVGLCLGTLAALWRSGRKSEQGK